MRSNLAVAIDIDANIDTAKIGGIEPDLKMALPAVRGRCDLHGEPAQSYGRIARSRYVQ